MAERLNIFQMTLLPKRKNSVNDVISFSSLNIDKPAYQRISYLSHPKYRFFQHQVCNIFPMDSVNIFVYCGKVIFTEYYVYYPNITPLWLHLDNNSVGIAIVVLLKCDLSENRV